MLKKYFFRPKKRSIQHDPLYIVEAEKLSEAAKIAENKLGEDIDCMAYDEQRDKSIIDGFSKKVFLKF